jgi:iron complex outermembrane recepter protein
MKLFIATIFSVLSVLPNAFAQTAEAPVFETTVTTEPLKSSSRKVFTQKEIAASGATTVVQLLTEQAGLTMTNSAFAPNALYMRGGDAGHIIFLIDGFPVYDAISDKRTFNLNSINLASIKKIEVINGSQQLFMAGKHWPEWLKSIRFKLLPRKKILS